MDSIDPCRYCPSCLQRLRDQAAAAQAAHDQQLEAACPRSVRNDAPRAAQPCPKTASWIFRITLPPPGLRTIEREDYTWQFVEGVFQRGWMDRSRLCPSLSRIYEVVDCYASQGEYTDYRDQVGNEEYLFHGTSRECGVGQSTTTICESATCSTCNIIRWSYTLDLAQSSGWFGPGIYTTCATSKAEKFAPGQTHTLFMNKVAVGRPYRASAGEVKQPPYGYDSVIFDGKGIEKNETIVYREDAIRPAYLLLF